MALPERFSGMLGGFIEDLKAREVILGFGLFGSWSRGDATPTSDIDFLVVESRDYDYDYVERIEINGCLLDLNHVSRYWIMKMPPEIDQKIYELQVLFDRDGSLTRAKNLISRIYWKPERVELRTESYLFEADSYLSRAREAFVRSDYRSAKVNAIRSFWALAKILIEAGKKLILNSSFIRNLEPACKSLDMYSFYKNYIAVAGFEGLSKSNLKSILDSLTLAWEGMVKFCISVSPLLKNIHPRLSAKFNYYGRESFLKGLKARINELLEVSSIETANYIFHTLMDVIESYTYVASTLEGSKFDYATIIKHLSELKSAPSEVYYGTIKALRVENVSDRDAENALRTVADMALDVRQKRKGLIARLSG
ncbi:MAG: nucleotidyltransferase domain-containing protein [Candidatus Bathyarchaeia archaeon]